MSAEANQMPPGWQLGRISVGFYIDLMEIARDGRDLLGPLLLTAVVEANVAPINQDPARQRQYVSVADPPPDQLRRPASIHSVAQSLSLPFESVRRRLHQLASAGLCEIGPKGVLVPAAVLSREAWVAQSVARYHRLRRLYGDLREHVGFDTLLEPHMGPAVPPPTDQAPPVRLCNRLISEYALRISEVLLSRLRSPLAVFIVLNIARANIRGLPLDEGQRHQAARAALRRPARARQIAELLDLPAETVRRRLADLERLGYVTRLPQGYILSDNAVQGELLRELVGAAYRNTSRMFAKLKHMGVLARWDAGIP